MNVSKYEPIFGSWRIVEELGSGAEGSLYRICRTDALGNKIYSALKAVSVPAKDSEIESLMAGGMSRGEVAEYFESVLESTTQEFELLAKLKGNSNIVSYEDHEIYRHDDGIGWDVLIRLEELTPLVRYSIDNPLSAEEVARMGRDICRGLSLCRKFGIVHRDIKPDNIFISPSGSYKLGDFGIARIIEQSTMGLSRKGTYEYMAPEVYWGQAYGASVDLYSLGMVMYRYLNEGRMPFVSQSVHAGDRENAFVKRINGHEIPAPRHGSDELKHIVLKACAHKREDRYKSAEEMLKDLEALKIEESTSALDDAAASDGGAGTKATITANSTINDVGGKKAAGATSATSGGAGQTESGASDRKADNGDDAQKTEIGGATRNGGRTTHNKKARIAIITLAALVLIGLGVWVAIPKEVTDIDAGTAEGGAEIYIGDDLTLECTVQPDWFKDEPVSFASGDESVFTVDESGKIHALELGEAPLTMTAKEYSEELTISVVPKVTAIDGIDEKISLTTGDTVKLEPKLSPKKFADEPIEFSTKDKKIATISKDGGLTAIAAGETKLTVYAGGCTMTAAVTVSDPVVYYPSYTPTKKTSGKSSSKKKSKANKGYFDSSDDEHF